MEVAYPVAVKLVCSGAEVLASPVTVVLTCSKAEVKVICCTPSVVGLSVGMPLPLSPLFSQAAVYIVES